MKGKILQYAAEIKTRWFDLKFWERNYVVEILQFFKSNQKHKLPRVFKTDDIYFFRFIEFGLVWFKRNDTKIMAYRLDSTGSLLLFCYCLLSLIFHFNFLSLSRKHIICTYKFVFETIIESDDDWNKRNRKVNRIEIRSETNNDSRFRWS